MTKKQNTIPLSAEQLRAAMAASSVPLVTVDVPGLGAVGVKPLTVADVQSMGEPAPEVAADVKAMGTARGVAMVLCDADGNRIFDPNNPDDLRLISRQGWDRMAALVKAANEAAGAVAKND